MAAHAAIRASIWHLARHIAGESWRATPVTAWFTARVCAGQHGGAMKTWFTVTEGAEYAGVSRDTIYTACERGELRHARIGGRRSIRLKPEWIDAWLEQHTYGSSQTPISQTS
jgi:excisionase family DNA binding protein